MKFLITIILIFLQFTLLLSQNTFDLKSYKFRYQNYKGLNFGGALNQRGNNNENPGGSTSQSQFQLNGSTSYFSFMNTNHLQKIINTGFILDPFMNTQSGLRKAGLGSSVWVNTVYRFYDEKNHFKGFVFHFTDHFNSEKNSLLDTKKIFLNNNSTLINTGKATFTIGKGRAEYISDAVNVLRLYEELNLNHLLLREINSDDINGLSQIIINYQNKRILDSRINRISMIDAMVNFLKANQLMQDCNAKTFAILNDQIYFAMNQTRYSGKVSQFEAGVESGNQKFINKTDSSRFELHQNNITPGISYSINKFIPLNVQNQINKGIELGMNYRFNRNGNSLMNSDFKNRVPQIIISAYYERGFYPNTRTAITWTNRISSENIKNTTTPKDINLSLNHRFISGLSIYYYFSPQLRLNVSESLNLFTTQVVSNSRLPLFSGNLNNSLYASLTYSLF